MILLKWHIFNICAGKREKTGAGLRAGCRRKGLCGMRCRISGAAGTSMNKYDEMREHTTEALKDAFWELYEKKPIESIRIQDITDRAGVHRATFYLYYTDIFSLLDEECDEMTFFLAENSERVKERPFEDSINVLVDFFEIYGEKLNLLLGRRYNDALMNRFKEIMFPKLRGNLGLDDSLRSRIICEYLVQGMQMAFRTWYAHGKEMTTDDFIELLKELALNGVQSYVDAAKGMS